MTRSHEDPPQGRSRSRRGISCERAAKRQPKNICELYGNEFEPIYVWFTENQCIKRNLTGSI